MSYKYRQFLITFLIGALPALLLMLSRGIFSAPELQTVYLIVADGTFLSAVLLISLGLLSWMANLGQFTSLKYVGHLIRATFAWRVENRKLMSYGEFKESTEAGERDREYRSMLYAGLLYLLIAIASTILFNQ